MVLQETYEVLDTSFYDTGITGTTATWWKTATMTVGADGTTVSNDTTSNKYIMAAGNDYNFAYPCALEFDVLDYSGNIGVNISSTQTSANNKYLHIMGTNVSHVKITVADGEIKVYADGVLKPTMTTNFTGSMVKIGFLIQASASFKYKNLIIYPL